MSDDDDDLLHVFQKHKISNALFGCLWLDVTALLQLV